MLRQIGIKAPVAIAELGVIEPKVKEPKEVVTGVKRPEEVVTGAGRSKKVATGAEKLEEVATEAKKLGEIATAGAKRLASFSLPTFLLLLAFLLSLTSLAFK